LERFAQSTHDQWRLHTIHSLQALAHFQLGQRTKAFALVQEAISAAQPEHIVRTFADFGPAFTKLLRAVRLQSLPPGMARYIDAILSATLPTQRDIVPEAAGPTSTSTAQSRLISPLTVREIEVLLMLNRRLSDKEIAQALFITTFTVQSHARNIYRKLDVRDRHEAAQKARALGFAHQTSSSTML
jgi:ATP/maltotriose-dependent transcriptional regulator MalT